MINDQELKAELLTARNDIEALAELVQRKRRDAVEECVKMLEATKANPELEKILKMYLDCKMNCT